MITINQAINIIQASNTITINPTNTSIQIHICLQANTQQTVHITSITNINHSNTHPTDTVNNIMAMVNSIHPMAMVNNIMVIHLMAAVIVAVVVFLVDFSEAAEALV